MQTPPEEATSNAAAWLEVFGAASWGEGFTPATDIYIQIGLYGAGALFFVWLVADALRRRRGKSVRQKPQRDFSRFDMPIEQAIDHIVDSTNHPFTSLYLAENNAFEQLHKAMSTGLLAVIGKHGENEIPRKISPRRCRKLHRVEGPTPHGVRFYLGEVNPQEELPPPSEQSKRITFRELRVRSEELYKT